MTERYCKRCVLVYEIARRPGQAVSIVLPPHDYGCPKIAAARPLPLGGEAPEKTNG